MKEEIERLKKLNKLNRDYIKKLKDSEQIINGFFIGREQVYNKLETLCQEYS